MKIIQNFSNKKHITEFPLIDLMIWYVGLRHYKELGYTTKLYCEERDIPFLKEWHLYKFYDEIDTSYLSQIQNDLNFNKINDTNFWSIRKLFCIKHEFDINTEDFIYSDTDIILMQQINVADVDLVVWAPEQEQLYLPWRFLSTPPNYSLPDYFVDDETALNCGILWFKSKELFNDYFNEYLKFVIDNPCKMIEDINAVTDACMRNIWACNAEQRILYSVARFKNNWKILILDSRQNPLAMPGFTEVGIHYFFLRNVFKVLELQDNIDYLLGALGGTVKAVLVEIEKYDKILFEKFMANTDLYEFWYNNITLPDYI